MFSYIVFFFLLFSSLDKYDAKFSFNYIRKRNANCFVFEFIYTYCSKHHTNRYLGKGPSVLVCVDKSYENENKKRIRFVL